ncbi:ribonuclease J [Alphaproteobacteria bacterium]
MTFHIDKYKNDLLFLALGGASEIGVNLNLYYCQGKWLMVDLGIGFAEQNFPGIDITLPKINFIEQYKHDLLGIFITHAHEDHIGGVHYLWHRLGCPIYATKFTAEILKAKFAEIGENNDASINIVQPNKVTEVGPFAVEMVGVTHSIPEMQGLMIRTKLGNIFHTGDWKLDLHPILGEVTNESILRRCGDEGVLALIGDSTNIFTCGSSGSEGMLSDSLTELIKGRTNGLVVVTTFASNIARLYSIAKAAQKSKRTVLVAGRALWRLYNAALHSGYLSDIPPFVSTKQIGKLRREEVLVICTGCQGEPLAATGKIAGQQHPDIHLQKGDTIIFSSKIIPGNEKKIFRLFNKFCKIGVEVFTERDHFVHVSGHPSRDEVAKMYELIRPKIAIPVHGEAVHLHEHCKFATSKGVKHSIEISNGDVVHLNAEIPYIITKVESGYLAIDGNYIVDESNPILRERAEMRDNGLVMVIIVANKQGRLLCAPRIIAPGLLDKHRDGEFISILIKEIKSSLINMKKLEERTLGKSISHMVKKLISKERGKDPKIIIQLEHIH